MEIPPFLCRQCWSIGTETLELPSDVGIEGIISVTLITSLVLLLPALI